MYLSNNSLIQRILRSWSKPTSRNQGSVGPPVVIPSPRTKKFWFLFDKHSHFRQEYMFEEDDKKTSTPFAISFTRNPFIGVQGDTGLGPGRSKAGALLHQVVDHLGEEVVTTASKVFSIWVLLTSQPFMDCTTLTIVTLRDTPQRQWTRTRPPVDRASWMNLIWWWPVVLRGQSFVMNIRRSLWTCG